MIFFSHSSRAVLSATLRDEYLTYSSRPTSKAREKRPGDEVDYTLD